MGNEWMPCDVLMPRDYEDVLVLWRDKRIGCENEHVITEAYRECGEWKVLFNVDMSDYSPVGWKHIHLQNRLYSAST